MSEVELRQNLPMGWPDMADDGRLAREYRARVERLIAYIAGNPAPFDVLADSLTPDYSSLSSGLLRRAIDSNGLTLASLVRMRDDAEAQIGESAEQCVVRCGSKELEMPAAVLPALQYLQHNRPCAVGALPDAIDEESKLVLVRRLMAEGIVDAVS